MEVIKIFQLEKDYFYLYTHLFWVVLKLELPLILQFLLEFLEIRSFFAFPLDLIVKLYNMLCWELEADILDLFRYYLNQESSKNYHYLENIFICVFF